MKGFSSAKRFEIKGDASVLVAKFDQRLEKVLIGKLQEKFLAHNDDPIWIIDPINETTNFVHGLLFIAISVALAINKQLVIDVTYNSVLEHLYSAVLGKGAFKNGRPIKCSQQIDD
ncbi:unnamed protein product [Adineta ricciae]|uniref:Uncharacterized protein n=1 Tax=Adineta ricciae TaxID=249248 RepID=A0A816FMV9_ADIRI|nr:unnamed protein product [Adineta ricciae]